MRRFVHLMICGALVIGAASAFQKQPKIKSQKEFEAYKAMAQATTPDAQIAAAENLLTNFADTDLKAMALFLEADSYARKNQFEKSIVFAERSLEADPQNFQAMLLLARQYAGHTGVDDLDKEEKLTKASKYAKDALASVAAAPKPSPQIPDAQWDTAKKDYAGQAHEALGMIADVRKKYDESATEFKMSVDMQAMPDPATMVRYAIAEEHLGKYDEALATLDKVIADPSALPVVKQYATNEKAKATAAKGAAKK